MEDFDLFSDEPPVIQARAGAKFQPKFKRKAKNGNSASIPSKPPEITKEKAATVATAVIDAVQVVEPDSVVDDSKSSQVINPSQLAATDSLHAEAAVCDDTNSSVERSVGEVIAMEDSDLFPDEPLVTQDGAGAKFKGKAKDGTSGSIPSNPPEITKEKAATVVTAVIDAVQVVEPDSVVDDSKSSQVINPSQLAATDSLHAEAAVCDDTNSSVERSVVENADLISGLECFDPLLTQSSNNDGDTQNDYEGNRAQFQEAGALPDIDTLDVMSGRCAGKFKLKPKLQTSVLTSPPAAVESVMHPPDAQLVPSETVVGEGSIPDLPTDHVPNRSPVGLGSFIPPDPSTSECQLNEGPLNLGVASNSGADVYVPVVPREVSSNIIERNTSPVSNPSRKSKRSSTRDKVNGNGKVRKQLREQGTNLQIVNDLENGTSNDDGLPVELPHSCAINEVKDANNGDENDNDEHNVEHVSAKRRTSKKRSKKPVNEDENENEKPPRKSKRANKDQKPKEVVEASDIPEKEQKKKFSHSTRRKRRFVDESLLTMPEDEIDFARVALKDLILLADYKDRLAKKEAKALGVPLTDQSTQKTFDEENARDEESYIASEQDQGFTDDQVSGSAKSNSYFNYQTYMDKTPRAIRQFGPDFSLIEQLFPGRNRHQIKLKFKNEERRSPFKLSEALASRANDHSYFEKVIEQLRQVSGADPESNGDVSTDLTREEEEFTPGTNEEVAKTEQDEDVATGDQEADVTDDRSSLKSDEMDDDNEILSSYKSAF
ncbi:hypothetical protein V6N13_137451 [Hibiscus sabdariffa]|uniref:Transcription factor TFIIIB component B'' Myb domain-containing protein n=1 Tax=Hibiscus sabdariffa TaxID=183260 RepID=A0ABR2DKL8_9ROSI